MKYYGFIVFLFCSIAGFGQGSWTQRSAYPGQVIISGVGFAIGNKGYVGTGMDAASGSSNEFYEYDPASDSWLPRAAFPGPARHFAAGFSIGSKGYIGSGFDGSSYYNDFWEYDAATNAWTQKANVPGPPRATAMAFSFGGKGYMGAGAAGISGMLQDLWEYDPSANAWQQQSNFPGTARMDMERPFIIGSKLYCGNGLSSGYCNDFWAYDIPTDSWMQKANFGGSPRYGCTGFAICNYGYAGFGQSSSTTMNTDLWKYDPAANSWTQVASLPVGKTDAAVFVLGGKAYVGPGSAGKDFWEYTPDSCETAGMEEPAADFGLTVYPNPSKGIVTVSSGITKGRLEVYNYNNEQLLSVAITGKSNRLDLGNFPKGIYVLKMTCDKGTVLRKLVKE